MVKNASSKPNASDIAESLAMLAKVKDRAVDLGRCEELDSKAMQKQLNSALDQLDVAVNQSIVEGKAMIANMPASAVAAAANDLAVYRVPDMAETAIGLGIKEAVLTFLEAILGAVPIPKLWKVVITALIALVRAIQASGNQQNSVYI